MDVRLLLHPNSPGFWVIASLFGWIAIQFMARSGSPRQLRWLNAGRWVLIPYAGLLAGSLSPQLMGLIGIDWQATLGIGIVLVAVLLTLMAFVRFTLSNMDLSTSRNTTPIDTDAREAARVHESPITTSNGLTPDSKWLAGGVSVLMAGAEQFHWSFLRGAVWEIALLDAAGTDPTGYWSVWIASLIALPELLLQPLNQADRLSKATILIISAIIFVFTHNFWLCWVFHAAAWLLLATGRPSSGRSSLAR